MKSKTVQLINTFFEQVDPSQVQPDDNLMPDATNVQDTEEVSNEITANQIVNLATIMRDFIVNMSQFGNKLDTDEVARLSGDKITAENAMQKISEYSRIATSKQPDMGVNIPLT
jgi:hypothetical protein